MADSTAGASGRNATSDREIVVTRVVDAPRERVFEAWTDPEQIGRWWGPRGFTTTTYEMDVRPGGTWRFVMHGPDGVDYQNTIVYTEIEAPARIAYDHVSGPKFRAEATFEDSGGRTAVTMRMTFDTPEERATVVEKVGADEGLKETIGRLVELVEGDDGLQFVFERTFDAPRDLVWKAWTEPERLVEWWGPKGLSLRIDRFELEPGGTFLYAMIAPDGNEMRGKFVYREIVPPERLVFVVSFCGPDGAPTRHPLAPTWPLEVLSVVELTERFGKTTIVGRSRPINASDEESETFKGGFVSMRQGWGGTLDALDAYLARP